ncbi:MAG: CoA ester lyase [Hyphomicrobiales bacterium]|nr:CoA ester lyase [Hyphomicrobiales bacterium]
MAAERSLLFVPGDRPERFGKALASGADRVIIDLEDAVAPEAKGAARQNLVRWLESADARDVIVRVNAVTTAWYEDDMRALGPQTSVIGLMAPKAEEPDAIAAMRARMRNGTALYGLVETVRGFAQLRRVAQAKGVTRLAFGSVDFCLETGIEGQGAELDFVRAQLTVESCLAGLAAPIEGVTVDIKSQETLEADVTRARKYGFGGKLCIHPAQVAAINRGFSPSVSQIDWARRVLSAARAGAGATTVDGKMVDRPVILQAEKILAQAGAEV